MKQDAQVSPAISGAYLREMERLRSEVDGLRAELRDRGLMMWAAAKTNGGQVRVSRLALAAYHPGVQLARWEDLETGDFVFGTND